MNEPIQFSLEELEKMKHASGTVRGLFVPKGADLPKEELYAEMIRREDPLITKDEAQHILNFDPEHRAAVMAFLRRYRGSKFNGIAAKMATKLGFIDGYMVAKAVYDQSKPEPSPEINQARILIPE